MSKPRIVDRPEASGLEIVSPLHASTPWNEAQVLGSAVWLWMHSAAHRDAPLHTLNALLMPALKHRHFMLAFDEGRPVFYMSWAELSAEAERRYIDHLPIFMRDADWASGERLWILDWVAPFGHSRPMSRLVRSQIFEHRCWRSLYHRSAELKIKQFHGTGVVASEAHAWQAAHPVAPRPTGS